MREREVDTQVRPPLQTHSGQCRGYKEDIRPASFGVRILDAQNEAAFSTLGAAILEENGRLWVPTFELESEGLTYDVFGTDGVFEDKVFIRTEPRKLKPLLFKAGLLYSIDTDDEGLQRVRRSRVLFN